MLGACQEMTDPAGKRGPGSVSRPAGSISSPVGRFQPGLSQPGVFGKPSGGTGRFYQLDAGKITAEYAKQAECRHSFSAARIRASECKGSLRTTANPKRPTTCLWALPALHADQFISSIRRQAKQSAKMADKDNK
jgi:hypothetical protein